MLRGTCQNFGSPLEASLSCIPRVSPADPTSKTTIHPPLSILSSEALLLRDYRSLNFRASPCRNPFQDPEVHCAFRILYSSSRGSPKLYKLQAPEKVDPPLLWPCVELTILVSLCQPAPQCSFKIIDQIRCHLFFKLSHLTSPRWM